VTERDGDPSLDGTGLSGDREASQEGKAEIHWGDETGLSNQAHYGRSFAPKGEKFIDDQQLSSRSNIARGSRPAK